jgi:carbonic anhydrase
MASIESSVDTEEDELNPMDGPGDMVAGYQRFRSNTYKRQVSRYRELGLGQEPKIMLIACADSRADPSAIFDAAPGQLFVVRNVANLVPHYEGNAEGIHGVSAALEFAVTVLKVQHVVVMGHGGCGGVAASLAGGECGEFIGPWVRLLSKAREKVLCSGSFNPQYALELEGIDTSVANLRTFPFVNAAIAERGLQLHGAWFAIHHGELHWRNEASSRFEVVPTKVSGGSGGSKSKKV